MEELENVHVKPVGLNGEMPRRIVHHPQSKSIVIVTERSARHPMLLAGPQREEAFVKLMHDKSFELLDSQALLEGEAPQALCLLPVAGEIDPLVVVGTALVVEGEEEPSEGRILAFRISARQLQLVSATLVRGAVYSIAALTPDDATPDEAAPPHPKAWLAACINNRVHVLEVPRSLSGVPQYQVQASSKMGVSHEKLAPPMRALVSASGFVIALFVEATGCTFAVGDIMKSVTVMRYDPVANTLDVVAKDPAPSWVTSICMLDARHVVATDTEHNLYLTAIPQDANPGGVLGKPRLEMRAEMRMGEFVNRIRLGHLRPAADDALVRPLALSGSVNGQISVLANVGSAHDFATLLELQAALVDSDDLAPPVARFEYGAWRAFSSARKTVEMHGIVDGDLVERFATELQRHEQDQVARVMAEKLKRPVSVDEVMRLVEDIQRLH
ncbi:CPSF A subunit region-domain-containing protein [Blastocladiella britannica]|nr:CPSF A subunit region-domain-containing protein [Blastocladiella britannica]